LDTKLITELAERLARAERDRHAITCLTADTPDLSVEAAYAVQRALVGLRTGRGERIVAIKGGLTSKAKQLQMHVDEPLYGVITDRMVLDEGEALRTSELIHPRVEPEIACFLAADLRGPGVTSEQALAALEWVAPALEVLDSRYEDFRFTLPDVVADNASSARIVISDARVSPRDLNLRLLGVVFEKNGEVVETAAGAAILGHPANAIAWVANKLAEGGDYLPAGSFILPGALANAHPVAAGDTLRVEIDRVGSLTLFCR
jgi:2-oxo-3-hexenedioate decarboxylase